MTVPETSVDAGGLDAGLADAGTADAGVPDAGEPPPVLSLTDSTVALSAASVTAGKDVVVTFTARDAQGAPWEAPLSVSFRTMGGMSTGTFHPTLRDPPNLYRAVFTAQSAGTATTIVAHVGSADAPMQPSLTVTSGPVSVEDTVVTVSRTTVPAGETADVTVALHDAFGNALAGDGSISVELGFTGGTSTGTFGPLTLDSQGRFTSTLAAVTSGTPSEIRARVNGVTITSSRPKVTVTAGSPSPSGSTLVADSQSVVSGSAIEVSLQVRDGAGNPIASAGRSVAFALSGGTSTGTFGAVTDHGDGRYSALFTGVLAGTAAQLSATLDGQPVTTPAPAVTVVPGAPSVDTSTVVAANPTVVAGNTVVVTLTLRDAAGNALISGGQSVGFSASGGTSTGKFTTPVDAGDGTHTADFTGLLAGTPLAITATIEGATLTTPPAQVAVLPGGMDVSSSRILASRRAIAVGESLAVTLELRDAYGNLTGAGTPVAFSVQGGSSAGAFSAVTDPGDGTFTTQFTGSTAGSPVELSATVGGSTVDGPLVRVSSPPGVDVTPPAVGATWPQSGAQQVPLNLPITVTFDEAMDPASLTVSTFTVSGQSGAVSYAPYTRTATWTPVGTLPPSSTITVTLDGVTDASGNALPTYSFSFVTHASMVALSGKTDPLQKPAIARYNGAETMVLWEVNTGLGSIIHWAHEKDGRWDSGELGPGTLSADEVLATGSGFAAYWQGKFGYFDQGTWTVQPLSLDRIVANGSSVIGLKKNQYGGLTEQTFDGSTWTAPGNLPFGSIGSYGVGTNPSSMEMLYIGSQNKLFASEFNGSTWGPSTLVMTPTSLGCCAIQVVGNGTSYAAFVASGSASTNGNLAVLNPSTGVWAVTQVSTLMSSPQLVTDGVGWAAAWRENQTLKVLAHDGVNWGTPSTLSTSASKAILSGTSSGYVLAWVEGKSVRAAVFEAGNWNVQTLAQGTTTAPKLLSATGQVGARGVIWSLDGETGAAVVEDGSWRPAVQVSPTPSGDASLVPLDTRLALVAPVGRDLIAATWERNAGWSAVETVARTRFGGAADEADIALNSNGDGVAVWTQYERDDRSVWMAPRTGGVWGTPSVVASSARLPKAVWDGTRFLISYSEYDPPYRGRIAAWSQAGGLGAAVDVIGSRTYSYNLSPVYLAHGAAGLIAVYYQPSNSTSGAYYSRRSTDGVTWTPPKGHGSAFVSVSANDDGFLIVTSSSTLYAARFRNGGWEPPHALSGTSCVGAGGAQTFAVMCSATTSSALAHVADALGWTQSTLAPTGGTLPTIAAEGDSYRVLFGNQTSTWSVSGWTAPTTIPGLSFSTQSMSLCGGESVVIGASLVNGTTHLSALKTANGVFSSPSLFEENDGPATRPVLGCENATVHAVWAQSDAAGSRRIYAASE